MKPKLTVVKLGGNCLDNQEQLHRFLTQFAKIEGAKILAHGGGKLASSLSEKLGVATLMIDGRRITDEATIDIVTMVYAGLVNKKIVAFLHTAGCIAIGLSGADGNVVHATKRNPLPIDYGLVGDPDYVNTSLLVRLLAANFTPVISPITHDGQGQLLNTNADTIAATIAAAMTEHYNVHLLFAFEKLGVLDNPDDNNSVIRQLTRSQYQQLAETGKIHSGMLPKLTAGFAALENKVDRVTITHLDALNHSTEPFTTLEL
jgi:acetylglutamate kinase